jgi:electron transfer flavoprotein beta subunit
MKALALGADKAVHLKSDIIPSDPGSTAKVLANELRELEFDVLLFGKKGVDDDNQQVGPMVAELLGVPCVTQIVKLEISDRKAVAHREVEGGSITVETSLPAAFTSEKDLTVPRYASLRELVAARKKPIVVKEVQLPPSSIEVVSVKYPPPHPPGRIVGKGVDAVPSLVKLLHEEAKVI